MIGIIEIIAIVIFAGFMAFILMEFISDYYKNFISFKKQKKEQFIEWWKTLSRLRQIYFSLASFAGIVFIIVILFLTPKFIMGAFSDEAKFYDIALSFFATISGLGVLFGFYTSIIRTETAEQGLITDRINKAVEGLGKSNLKDYPVVEVRLGALYALERIAQDSIRDHVQIIEILCAYIRHNSPLPEKTDLLDKIYETDKTYMPDKIDSLNDLSKINEPPRIIKLREDIQAALTIIGRRGDWSEGKKRMEKERQHKYIIDMSECDLHGAKLDGAKLRGAEFHRTDLRGAYMEGADLKGADFGFADLSHASLKGADMEHALFLNTKMIYTKISHANLIGVILTNVKLNNAVVKNTNFGYAILNNVDMSDTVLSNTSLRYAHIGNTKLKNTDFYSAKIEGAYADNGNFLKCRNLTQDQINYMFFGINVKIPKKLIRPQHWPENDMPWKTFFNLCREWQDTLNYFVYHPLKKTKK